MLPACINCDEGTEDTCDWCGWPCCVDCNADTVNGDLVCPECWEEGLAEDNGLS